jgi:uncharacterized protein (DUF2235 family)
LKRTYHEEYLAQEREELIKDGLLKTNVTIKACGVWETVKSLPLGGFAFVGMDIPQSLERVFHALALDESTGVFEPMYWMSKPEDNQCLQQCWFLGNHPDVGGGNEDAGLANISLVWMIDCFMKHTDLKFDEARLMDLLSPAQVDKRRGRVYSHTISGGWSRTT